MNHCDLIFDMETQDPDDFLTLILLCGHPKVNLKAVTLVPGSPYQIGLVKWLLAKFPKYSGIPVGYFDINCRHNSVSAWHYKSFGEIPPSYDASPGSDIISSIVQENPSIILLTGGPLKNIANVIRNSNSERPFALDTIVIQGGFAGTNIVPFEKQLSKFHGMKTCPTFNLGGDIPAARLVLESPLIRNKFLVSKNVCHGVTYNHKLHTQIGEIISHSLSSNTLHLQMIHSVMSQYRGEKKLHDPFAACCAINRAIGEFVEVEMYCERVTKKGYEWGARKVEYTTNTFIIIDYDRSLFLQTFCDHLPEEGTK